MLDFISLIIDWITSPRMAIPAFAGLFMAAAVLAFCDLWPWTGIVAGFLTLAGITIGLRWESSAEKNRAEQDGYTTRD